MPEKVKIQLSVRSAFAIMSLKNEGKVRTMRYIPIEEFKENIHEEIDNTLLNEEIVAIETEEGSVVMLTEHQFNCILESMVRHRPIL